MKTRHFPLRSLQLAVVSLAIVFTPQIALAHAVLLASTPSAHATIKGPEITVHLKFNSRIDGARSRLYLADSNGTVRTLKLTPQDAPDSIAAESITLSAGEYTIRWQALAADGHITRGEIPFAVQ
jgi:methionine-rich copper-binding protein CopC